MAIVLGINAFHAGAAAALVVDGEPVAAIAEERLNRMKYYAGFPARAVATCLKIAGVSPEDIDAIAVGRDGSANLAAKLAFVIQNASRIARPDRLLNIAKMRVTKKPLGDLKETLVAELGWDGTGLHLKQYDVEHHLAHTASAYFTSPWDHCAGITVDGSGDFVTCMMSECRGSDIKVKHRIFVPHSLGSLYTMVCQFIGYGEYGDEGKVMGLAPLGADTYVERFHDMIDVAGDDIRLNPSYFVPFGDNQGVHLDDRGQMVIERLYSDKMIEMYGEARDRHGPLTQRDKDLARALQETFESVYLKLLRQLYKKVPVSRVALAGGCALNSVANGKIFVDTPFKETAIHPAAGDDGLALGAALYVTHSVLKRPRARITNQAYLGLEYSEVEVRQALERKGVSYKWCDRARLLQKTTEAIASGAVVGWFQGRMEWGPRALGNRSILCHPGLPNMKDVLNSRIKHRESFRPFAPAVLEERQAEIFECATPSPCMLHVYKIRPEWRERLCAVNHVDNTGRLQTVGRSENPIFYELICEFAKKTGIPVLLNTSFNENEPIVCTPEEAIDCFLRTKMDALAIGPFICMKPALA
jgi:carbamoyltransferase